MTTAAKTWLTRFLKLAVTVGALWYLSDKVAIRDHARLADNPAKVYYVVGEFRDTNVTVRLRDPDSGQERVVTRSALARPEQCLKGQRPHELGLLSIARQTDWHWTFWAILAGGPSIFIMGWRLRLLLGTQDIAISLRDSTLITFAGNFYNFALPGTTGGDVYKAYHIAKQTTKRAEGVTIVLIDRLVGLISFLLIASVGILVLSLLGLPMIGTYGRWVGYLMIAALVGGGMYFSRRVRRWIRYDALLARLPFADKLRRIDDTTFNFRWHPWLAALSLLGTLVNHFTIILSVYFLARGLGIEPHGGKTAGELFAASLICTTVGYLFAAIPISIQGFGLFEAVFYRVLVEGGWCTPSQMLALTIGMRLVQVLWSLPGVIVPWLGFARPEGLNEIKEADAPQGAPQ